MTHVTPIDHRLPAVALKVHGLIALAYAQEAELMKAQRFTDFEETVEEVQTSNDFYLGALKEDELLGLVSIGPDDEPNQISISTLVVHPQYQRQGIGKRLLQEALRRSQVFTLSVSTGADNHPALRLYESLGFKRYRVGTIGPENLVLVKLRTSAP